MNQSKIKTDFARWMRTHLGYQSCEVDYPIQDTEASLTRFAAVRGEAYGITWYRLGLLAGLLLACSLVARVLLPGPPRQAPTVATTLFYLAATSYCLSLVGRLRTRRYSWVECKNLEEPLSRADVATLNAKVSSLRRSTGARWKPERILMVTGTQGFAVGAIGEAEALGIECYRSVETGFERLDHSR